MELVQVSGLSPGQEELFGAWANVFIDAAVTDCGDHDERSPAELRELERNPGYRRRLVAAVDGAEVAAAASVVVPLRDNLTHAWGTLAVLPRWRRQGLGSRLLAWVQDLARQAARDTLQMHLTCSPHRAAPGCDFARAAGFTLAQRQLRQDIDLPVETVNAPDARGHIARGELVGTVQGYDIVCGTGLGEANLADYARCQGAILGEIPLGGLTLEPEIWDVARVREQCEQLAQMGRARYLTWAIESHTGEVAGYTEVQWAPGMGVSSYQQDTLVLPAHRGHGLGRALKLANLRHLHEELPQLRTVRTWNADNNTAMLAVNRALGARVTAVTEEWQKTLR